MAAKDSIGVTDHLEAQLVECAPDAPMSVEVVSFEATAVQEQAPKTQQAQATIEQTGAGPPPEAA